MASLDDSGTTAAGQWSRDAIPITIATQAVEGPDGNLYVAIHGPGIYRTASWEKNVGLPVGPGLISRAHQHAMAAQPQQPGISATGRPGTVRILAPELTSSPARKRGVVVESGRVVPPSRFTPS
jgi:hypothetical protein